MSVVRRHRRTLERCSEMLHELKNNRNNLLLLLELQTILVHQVKRCEFNLRRIKKNTKVLKSLLVTERLSKEIAQEKKQTIQRNKIKSDEYKHLIFIWKCFGDGIANLYLDKYALKHSFYSVEDYSPKEAAGFITGKSGFRLEWKIIKKAIAEGFPVLLCDITNVIRHGDVCGLFGPDPILLEVKSSKNRSQRIDRQINNLERLARFYQEDGAEEFRGVPNVRRQEFVNPEVNHTEALNDCIQKSYAEGMATISPESGLHYVCIYGGFQAEKMENLCSNSSSVYFINELKITRGWIPYYPFTLSINPQHVFSFIEGSIYLLVIIDRKIIKNLFKSRGVHSTFLSDDEYILQICKNRENFHEGVFRISQNLFLRIPYEFQSIEWFVNETCLVFENNIVDGPLYEIPEQWFSVTDDLDEDGLENTVVGAI